ncbi:hypothetical protein [Rhodococcus xishaensis]|uniref:Uncharacterized protein n=1 Tax=Rhodococcus xishaensis TaxID=2487364 RepID=A0A3S3ACJ6_9NOCA|nr:hypothetical protein [Rhodococcus xishaensis]RVW01346.1 hypothetical protein EGT50_14140 [Rhodococcus xishaensis]
MEQDPEPRAGHISRVEMVRQIMIGILAGPLFIVGFTRVAGWLWEILGEWVGPLSSESFSGAGVVVAAGLAGATHRRYPRFRALAWTAAVAAYGVWSLYILVGS